MAVTKGEVRDFACSLQGFKLMKSQYNNPNFHSQDLAKAITQLPSDKPIGNTSSN